MTDECDPRHYGPQSGPVSEGNRFRYIGFNGTSSYINCGSDASLDNLPSGPFTLDLQLYYEDNAYVATALLSKIIDDDTLDEGWELEIFWDDSLMISIAGVAPATWAYSRSVETVATEAWHHIVAFYNEGVDDKIYLALDGVWCTYVDQDAMPLAGYSGDADFQFLMGRWTLTDPAAEDFLNGNMSWVRISSGDRFGVGVDFDPPAMCAPPAVDGTTLELWEMDEGTGALTAAMVNTPENDGDMTSCTWHRCK